MKLLESAPEFCPNPHCRFYHRGVAASAEWYVKFGTFETQCRGSIQRFRCKGCGKTCSTQTFSLHYWTHSTFPMIWLMHLLYSSSGLRQIGRFGGVSYRVIQNRVRRLARNSLAVTDELYELLALDEDLAMDGFESFTRSQYHPNNFTVVVGARSQHFYSVIYSPLRRKGRMRDEQKRIRSRIDAVYRAPAHAVRDDCAAMLTDLSASIGEAINRLGHLTLFTDRHPAYVQALKRVPALADALKRRTLVHHRTSSRAARTRTNPLFSVNYLDRQIRKNMGEHVRETVKQGREVNCQMERMVLFMFMHNFLTPHRIGDEARVDRSPRHAEQAGITDPRLKRMIERFLSHRHIWGHAKRKHEWMRRIWQHAYENPPAVRMKRGMVVAKRVALAPGELPQHLLA
jgi:hypothetical protein